MTIDLVALRRELHQIPEVGLQLPQTQARVLQALEGLPLEITLGTSVTSVVGVLRGGRPTEGKRPVVLLLYPILANIALREGDQADVQMVVADEYHFIADPDRGWAWQVATSELPQAQFMLMSATLGDVSDLAAKLTERTGRPTEIIAQAERLTAARQQALSNLIREVLPPLLPEGLSLPVR